MMLYHLTATLNILILLSLVYDHQRSILNHHYLVYMYQFKRQIMMIIASNIITLITMIMVKEMVWLNLLCISYYWYHYKVLGHKTLKREVYSDLLKGLYIKSHQRPIEKYDLVTNMSNGHRTHKELPEVLLMYLNKSSDKTVLDLFGPKGLVYDNSRAVRKYIKKHHHAKPYDYQSECGLYKISHEFFECLSYSTQPDVLLKLILSEFNGKYSIGQSDYRIDNLIRTIHHIFEINHHKLYTPQMMKFISNFVHEAIEGQPREDMRVYRQVKEQFLLRSYDQYLLKIKHYLPEEEFLTNAIN